MYSNTDDLKQTDSQFTEDDLERFAQWYAKEGEKKMDNSHAFDNYDQWKTTSPDDEYPDRPKRYRVSAKLQAEINQIREQLESVPHKKPEDYPTIESFFTGVPTGDFEYKNEEAGDWYPWYCDDCHTWHKNAYGTDMGRRDDKLWVEVNSCDSDGDWSLDTAWEEGDNQDQWVEVMEVLDLDRYFRQWCEYFLDCAETGKEPLDDFIGVSPRQFTRKCIESAREDLNYLIGNI